MYPVLMIVSTLLISCEKEVDPALLPVVSTTEVSSVSYYSAQSGGVITGDGGYDVIARGVCWSTSPNPDIKGSKTVDAAGTGTFESLIDSLMPGTTYYLRAYATNKKGTSYGLQVEFTTKTLTLSEVATSPVTSITTTSAVTGGTISIDGGTPITERGVCWSTLPNPTINDSVTIDGSGSGNFISTLSGLKTGTIYYVKAYATNSNGTAYGNERQFRTQSSIPEVITADINSITESTAISGGEILYDVVEAITARGVCWDTTPSPTINNGKTTDGVGIGIFTSNITRLAPSTTYYARAYATNSLGTAYGNEVIFTTSELPKGQVYNPVTRRIWMDRNLGASRVATSSTDEQAYGDLYQWGRGTDGHEKRNSSITSTLSISDTPGHGNFIAGNGIYYDWRSPQNNNLWQGVNGINNPCPKGFRIPTAAEWNIEYKSWSSNTDAGAFASPLKLPVAGSRYPGSALLNSVGSYGTYWSSTVNGTNALPLVFFSGEAYFSSISRAYGISVRCIKD